MREHILVLTAVLITSTAITGCGKQEVAPAEAPAAEEQALLEASIRDLDAKLEAPQQLLAELRGAQGDDWTRLRDRLLEAVGSLEQASQATANAVSEWKQREQAALVARSDMELPIVAKSGLIRGLDDGDYEPYLVSVVERVQRELRAKGLYAGPADGFFDVTTREAVGRFQEQAGLAVSGVPSPMTRARLFSDGG